MGGTPSRWRTLTNDTREEPGWTEAFRMMDVVQPWTVGRYRNAESVDKWKDDMIVPDLALAAKNHQIYMPVIFPGFSWYNLKRDSPKNAIPRNRGEFPVAAGLQRQSGGRHGAQDRHVRRSE